MSTPHDPAVEPEQHSEEPAGEPVLGPDDVDPVDHTVDRASIDGEEGAVPGEWL